MDDSKGLMPQQGSSSASHIAIHLFGRLLLAVLVSGVLLLIGGLILGGSAALFFIRPCCSQEIPTYVHTLLNAAFAVCPSIGAVWVWRRRRGFCWSNLIVLSVSIVAATVVSWADSTYSSLRVGVWVVLVMVAVNLPSFLYGLVEAILHERQSRAA